MTAQNITIEKNPQPSTKIVGIQNLKPRCVYKLDDGRILFIGDESPKAIKERPSGCVMWLYACLVDIESSNPRGFLVPHTETWTKYEYTLCDQNTVLRIQTESTKAS